MGSELSISFGPDWSAASPGDRQKRTADDEITEQASLQPPAADRDGDTAGGPGSGRVLNQRLYYGEQRRLRDVRQPHLVGLDTHGAGR
jgi:hypothetical protein